MAFLNGQVRVSIAQHRRVGTVDIRVEIADSGAGDAHSVVHTDVESCRDIISKTGRRHQITVVLLEVAARTDDELHVLPCMFIAQAGLCSELAQRRTVFGILGKNVLGVLVIDAVGCIVDLVSARDVIVL